MKKYFAFLGVFLALAACKKRDEGPDENLLGGWTDTNVNYYFYDDLSYGIKYIRSGSGQFALLADSLYGHYTLDKSKKLLVFHNEGYIRKADSVNVMEALQAPTWKYKIENDTLLRYESNSTIGELTRIP